MGLQFGIALDFGNRQGPLNAQIDRHLELIRAAEDHGFESVWLGEGYHAGPVLFHLASPFLVLAILARQTRLKLGTGVILLPAWHPVKLAYDAATLDHLSEGRFILGVGVGRERVWRRFGVPKEQVGDRVDDTLALLRGLWSGATGFQGKVISTDAGLAPLPVTPGGPPLWVGGGIRRSIERAVEFGQAYYSGSSDPFEMVARQAGRYREALAARGRDGGRATISVNRLTLVAPTEAEARAGGEAYVGQVLEDYALRGTLGPAHQQERAGSAALFRQLDASHCLVGTPEQVIARLQRYVDLGVTHVQARLSPGFIPTELALRTLELLAREVRPAFA